jgi:hypothetical protein
MICEHELGFFAPELKQTLLKLEKFKSWNIFWIYTMHWNEVFDKRLYIKCLLWCYFCYILTLKLPIKSKNFLVKLFYSQLCYFSKRKVLLVICLTVTRWFWVLFSLVWYFFLSLIQVKYFHVDWVHFLLLLSSKKIRKISYIAKHFITNIIHIKHVRALSNYNPFLQRVKHPYIPLLWNNVLLSFLN